MSMIDAAKAKAGALYDAGATFAAAKSRDISGALSSGYKQAKTQDYAGMARQVPAMGESAGRAWGAANKASAGYLNPTAIGMGLGGAVGGAGGAYSDNGSFLGGMAGGAMLGAAGGAGYKVGSSYLRTGVMTKPVTPAGSSFNADTFGI